MGLRKNKLLSNLEALGQKTMKEVLSVFHEPDNKWKNYYYEDEKQDLLFLLPTRVFQGIIVLDLSWARTATFQTKDGVVRRVKDCCWSMSHAIRKLSYVKATVIDRTAECGQRTVLLSSIVVGHLFQEDNDEHKDRFAADHLNGNHLDNRKINLNWDTIKANNDNRYPYKEVPAVKYPCEPWW